MIFQSSLSIPLITYLILRKCLIDGKNIISCSILRNVSLVSPWESSWDSLYHNEVLRLILKRSNPSWIWLLLRHSSTFILYRGNFNQLDDSSPNSVINANHLHIYSRRIRTLDGALFASATLSSSRNTQLIHLFWFLQLQGIHSYYTLQLLPQHQLLFSHNLMIQERKELFTT